MNEKLNEKLANALADISTKDNLVKQHVKVAEEAVTGWEKAEAEAVAMKAQLDVALQQKLATEDRVAHLDGALKECMKQLRHVREEQEQRIHDTLVKKSREYDKLRIEMETKLAESSHILSQTRSDLLESRAEVTALSHALQERSRGLAELSEVKGRADTEIKVLQVRLETIEKENSQLKYEVHVLNKELEIRSEEREYERKAVDMASKQHLESVKKITKLEEECNRLRLLVRKKLPGPAAIQRMRMEVEGIGKDNNDKARRRSLGRSASSVDQSSAEPMQENGNGNENGRRSREAQMLAERVVAMDEEMKMLKNSLAQRTGELQVARLMCSKTASRLSVVEEELNQAKLHHEPTQQVSESDPTKQGKGSTGSFTDTRRDSQNFELMDDFALMEQLAMKEALTESGISTHSTVLVSHEIDSTSTTTAGSMHQKVLELEESIAAKVRELEESKDLCQDLKSKLAAAEDLIAVLQTRNSANETTLINLQDQLDRLNEARLEQEIGGEHASTPISSKRLSGYTIKDILVRERSKRGTQVSSDASSSELGEVHEDHTSISDAESKASTVHSELAVAVCKILHIVEALAQATGNEHSPLNSNHSDVTVGEIWLQFEWENMALDNTMRNLAHVSNRFLQGKYDLIDFVTELGTALDSIMALKSNEGARHRGEESNEEIASVHQEAHKDLERQSEEFADLNAELDRLKSEKAETERLLEEANEQLEVFKVQPHEWKQLVSDRNMLLHDQQEAESPDTDNGKDQDDIIEEELMQLSSSNPALRAASGELSKLQDKVAALERELNGERQRYESVSTQLTVLQQQIRRGHAVSSEISGLSHGEFSSHSTSDEDEDDTKSLKQRRSEAAKQEEEERQIAAAALAECQRTILVLGKQLKSMGATISPPPDLPSSNSSESANSIQKMTENMELLRWQTEAGSTLSIHNHIPSGVKDRSGPGSPWNNHAGPRRAPRSPSPAPRNGDSSFYLRAENGTSYGNTGCKGPQTGFSSPSCSEYSPHEPLSIPGSPSRGSGATPQSNGSPRGFNADPVAANFSRFYSLSSGAT
ncbi:uncharacterized protein [Physcomitrium patens]|uniref:Filament-like plant protein n=1 Tax=Physcomitrium patens TaxID=3218 RepID=A0A2K1JDU1_PHYPA|nr:filament-like plant protein 4 isoform X1 [Physcomitrium patens]XP_024397597.1 filament-like plant protein 4 isoform X1 [Physcomitrium patens]XP_024397598.1 filament-like plant protein 4 isoform X1 [Physcomitrium patens]XP_024397599.1 filament-like plant protein 4 isoform X1 [Physcomitrium patens]XP_024397601.1 filament-like plant protein 4 isoform X1 [Physcomitrium patens]XP_024397602.1 filament-like plant protein 4 isoform X1 [Physcomitrium patens]XP_024397603.1 filament-like plant protei|eukprot:XP_024397596.1 filament-like plant protein 4 isoform X1 [Physcomitrella patens]